MKSFFKIIVLAWRSNGKLQICILTQTEALKKIKFSLSSELESWSWEERIYIPIISFQGNEKKTCSSIHYPKESRDM